MPGDSRLKPSTQRAFGSRKKRAWNKKAPATSAPSAAELESRPDPLDLPGTSTDDTVGPSSTSETLRVDAAYYSTAEQAQRVERSAQTKTVLSGKSATQRKFDLLGVSAECQTGDAGTDFLLVDMKVLNNFFAQAKCDKCDAKSLSVRKATDKEYGLAPQDEGYTDWLATHEFQRNIECNSGRTEVEAALTMFQRSWAKHGLRYMTVLSDGDSRTFHALSEAEVYGFIQIDKKDCINHVHKRMGAALRNLVDKKKAQGESLGGRGKLTQEKIKKIANYYGYTLRSNINDVPAMKRAPVSARLSDESLLARCCEGKTQNTSSASGKRTVSRIAAGGVPIVPASRSYPCSVLLLLPLAKVRRRNRMYSSRYRIFELLLIGSIRDSNCNGCKSALSAAMIVEGNVRGWQFVIVSLRGGFVRFEGADEDEGAIGAIAVNGESARRKAQHKTARNSVDAEGRET
ncbi:hypothetical protein HPB52_024183 [Rhipicephalus sanguineus]|uniref:Mutator-like transposase domain-containing protein n=1 Tax=Rhipicephalus sanguineus TaxID=34632 RepID=A0A9D4SX00_RHISA|nr:hypothetical protein HPB52_024183 [Rhipicephalus sanguineus]